MTLIIKQISLMILKKILLKNNSQSNLNKQISLQLILHLYLKKLSKNNLLNQQNKIKEIKSRKNKILKIKKKN